MSHARQMKVFAGNACPALAHSIVESLGVSLGEIEIGRFADGEVHCQFGENVRGRDVFIIQSTCRPVNDNLMELLIMIDTAKRASANTITAVIPYFGYARQDKKDSPRVPISAKLVADLVTVAGATRILAMDLHAGQIQGFFNIPFDHIFAAPIAVEKLREIGPSPVIVAPDAGGVERARAIAKRLEAGLAIIDKRRPRANEVEALHVIGEVEGRAAIFYDDMADTAGTLTSGARAALAAGAESVYAFATHAVLSGPAIDRISESPFEKIFVTDTIPLTPEAAACDKIEVLSVAGLFGQAIHSIHEETSISRLFI
ncbi:MAG: ribose-phosphate pyrophosphokinase [Acidobacteriota bacterium]|nr:ribose-phosphate pyrophosphokinase [Acidobacteriota bacterium]